jgi:hypothetical protein
VGKQRRKYDERRRSMLPQRGIALIELSVDEFMHDAQKRLLRSETDDIDVLRVHLAKFL